MFHCFIVNPIAGRINLDAVLNAVTDICQSNKLEYSCITTEYAGQAETIAYNMAIKHESVRIYSVGGDGTLNETANGLLKSGNKEAALIPVPLGSGNDFVRSTGYKVKLPLEQLIEKAVNCNVDEIDVCKANDISSMCFDAKVVINSLAIKKIKFIPKSLAYYISVFTTFIKMEPYNLNISVNGNYIYTKPMTLVAVANGKYYGGGIIPAPDADIKDGLIDVCFVEKVKRIKVPIFFPRYVKGKHSGIKEVSFIKCKNLHVKCEMGDIALNIDGDVYMVNEVLFTICDEKLKIGII